MKRNVPPSHLCWGQKKDSTSIGKSQQTKLSKFSLYAKEYKTHLTPCYSPHITILSIVTEWKIRLLEVLQRVHYALPFLQAFCGVLPSCYKLCLHENYHRVSKKLKRSSGKILLVIKGSHTLEIIIEVWISSHGFKLFCPLTYTKDLKLLVMVTEAALWSKPDITQ